MKQLVIILLLAMVIGCGDRSNGRSAKSHNEDNVEDNSGYADSAETQESDTLSTDNDNDEPGRQDSPTQ